MTVGLVVQVVVSGLAVGAAYGLIAAGFVLVFRLTGILNLAHGDLLGAGLFAALAAAGATSAPRAIGTPRYALAAAVALAVAAVGSALLYLLLLRPSFRRRAELGWIGTAVAAVFVIDATLLAAFPRAGYVFPDAAPFDRLRPIKLADAAIAPRALFVLAVGLVTAAAADALLTRTRFGLGLRAIADDPVAAALSGLRTDRLVAAAFAVAGALAAIAGLVVAPATVLASQTGLVLGLKGMAAALLAGMRSPRRAFAAGLALGVAETAVATLPALHLGPAWRDIGPLLLVLAYLAWRPPAIARQPVE
ncbi:MAG TPA: branched-chain amino acid ABC transporter permease [Acidimicrobiales bacterium]|nr:branched-chain amino acid ABC transporter permease [Acidimicrobiales bacterium]